jgi:hypothetical protein
VEFVVVRHPGSLALLRTVIVTFVARRSFWRRKKKRRKRKNNSCQGSLPPSFGSNIILREAAYSKVIKFPKLTRGTKYASKNSGYIRESN